MRPIDADALKEYKCSVCENRERCEDREQVCPDIAEIDEQPTIEAEPKKQGRWIITSEPCASTPVMHCGNCGLNTNFPFNYCADCGARMDGGKTLSPAAKMSDTPAEQLGLAPAT